MKWTILAGMLLVSGCGGGSTGRFADSAVCPGGGTHDPIYSCKYCEATNPESCCYFAPIATFSTCSCSDGSQITIDPGSCDPVTDAEGIIAKQHGGAAIATCECNPSPWAPALK